MVSLKQYFKNRKITILRRVVQVLSFVFINYIIIEFIFSISLVNFEGLVKVLPVLNSPRNPLSKGSGMLEYIFYSFAEGVFPLMLIGILILLLLASGRFFCGWICPIGTIEDGLATIPTKKKTFKMSTHKFLLKIKYVIVIFLLIIVVPLGITKTTDVLFYEQYKESLGTLAQKPTGYFSLSEFIFYFLPNLIQSIWETASLEPMFTEIGVFFIFLYFVVIITVSVWYPRAYCKYLCPFSAIASVVSNYSFLKLSRSPVRCVGRQECGICEKVCNKQIRILDEPFEFFTGGGECNLCLKCKERCPYKAILIKFG